MNIKFKYFLITVLALLSIIFFVGFYYSSENSRLIKDNEDNLKDEKKKREKAIDSLKKVQNEKILEFNNKIDSIVKSNNKLNAKIWNYENNPNFDDFDFMERARNVSGYKYKS